MINDYGIGANESEKPALNEIVEALDASDARVELRVGEDESIELPASAIEGLARVAAFLATADFVSIEPVDSVLTTQGAAQILGVSRPHLIRRLLGHEEGQIPFTTRGPGSSHRRVLLSDVLHFRERQALTTADLGRDALRRARAATRELPMLHGAVASTEAASAPA